MTPVLLDSVGLLAIWDEDDQWHVPATKAFVSLIRSKRPLFVTMPVLYECGNAAARRPYRAEVDVLRQRIKADGGLVDPTIGDVDLAWADYLAGKAGSAGIVDQVSFAVMRRLGLTDAFTNDKHFKAAGFTVLF